MLDVQEAASQPPGARGAGTQLHGDQGGQSQLEEQRGEVDDDQREVLDLVAARRNNAQIAASLYLSPKTVRNNVSNVLTKLQVADRAEAIVRAREAGLGR